MVRPSFLIPPSCFVEAPSRHFRRGRNGFTLIEVVAAMVLMVMLFVALTSLLRCFSKQNKTLDKMAAEQPSTLLLANQLERDLTNARFVRSYPQGFTLVGNLAEDDRTGLPSARLAEVTYRIDRISGEPWLMRKVVALDNMSTQRTRDELIWQGAANVDLIALSQLVSDRDDADPTNSRSGMEPMPGQVRLLIRGEQRVILDLHVLHHWEDS